MPIKMTLKVTGFDKALAHIKKVYDYMDDHAGEDSTKAGFNAAGTVFEKNFIAEGTGFGLGGWADLAESTVRKREAAGFGGEHPILFRYGDLRVITATSLRVADGSGTFAATDPEGKTIMVELNMGKDGGYARATGDKAWNQVQTATAPARPFWFTTRTVEIAVRKRVVETLADNIGRL